MPTDLCAHVRDVVLAERPLDLRQVWKRRVRVLRPMRCNVADCFRINGHPGDSLALHRPCCSSVGTPRAVRCDGRRRSPLRIDERLRI